MSKVKITITESNCRCGYLKKGDTFIALRGNTVDGHDYIEEAIKNGATKIIAEKGKYSVETLIVPNTNEYLINYLKDNYSQYFKDINFIGITGTNGKTTTAFITSQILNNLGSKTAYIGTIGFYIDGEKIRDLPNTTPEILTIYNLIFEAIDNGCKNIVMEVSSHSLDLKRIEGINFNIGAFTNLTEDHLDYHKTMHNYLISKIKILNHLKSDGIMITNVDDNYSKYFTNEKAKTIGIEKDADYKVNKYVTNDLNTNISFIVNSKEYEVNVNLLNRFNVYNYMSALAIINNMGYKIEDIIKSSKDLTAPSGRNEVIKVNEAKAIIDYAHTPDAVLKVISANREITKGKVITIIGCGGDRDPFKRPIMGKTATSLSDYVIFTNDNPRCENEEKIMNDIINGVSKDNYEIIFDRREAIKRGIDMLIDGDTLLILGKGHEDYQIIGREKIHLSDQEEVYKYLENKNTKVLKLK